METMTLHNRNAQLPISYNQIVNLLEQLNEMERINIFQNFETEIYKYFFPIPLKPMTIEEYNQRLAQSDLDIQEGRLLTSEQMAKEIESWKQTV